MKKNLKNYTKNIIKSKSFSRPQIIVKFYNCVTSLSKDKDKVLA